MGNNEPSQLDSLILGEIQVLLSEKRTALSTMRSRIAVFALPLSVLSVLIATSPNYNIGHVMPLLVPLLFLNLGLVVLGSWPVFRSSTPRSPLRSPNPRADPEIPVACGDCRVASTKRTASRHVRRPCRPEGWRRNQKLKKGMSQKRQKRSRHVEMRFCSVNRW